MALVAAGGVIFLPPAAFLAFSSTTQIRDWIALLIPLVVWLAGALPAFRPVRAVVQTSAGFLLVLMAFVVIGASDWISVTTTCFAVIVAAVFNLPTRGAAIVIAIATVLDTVYAYSLGDEPALFGVVLLEPWAGGLLQLLAGGGLLIAWHSWMRNVALADEEFEAIRQAAEIDQPASAARAGAEAVARRIHETILNTLAAIAMGVDEPNRDDATNACRRDLEQMQRNLRQLPASGLRDVIDAALATIQPSHLTCDVGLAGDRMIDASIANALHDALVEALRNVERHSGVCHARIDVTVNDVITVQISDQGCGPSTTDTERFGLRNAIRSNMASVGGNAQLMRNSDGGTTVALTVPAKRSDPPLLPSFPILGAADASLIGRLGAAGTNVFMLLILIPVAKDLPLPTPMVVATIAYVAVIFALAFAWRSVARGWLNWLGIGLLIWPFIAVSWAPLPCEASPAVQGLITGMSGGGVLLLLVANAALSRRLLIYVLAIAGPIATTLRLPSACNTEATLTVGIQVIYIGAIITVLTWIDRRFEVRRNQAQQTWQDVLDERTSAEHQSAVSRGWTNIGPNARDLLEGIADRTLKPGDPEVRTRAAAEGAAIRSKLGLALDPGDAFSSLTRRLVRLAGQVGATVDAEMLTPTDRSDRFPEGVLTYLEDVARQCEGATITIRAFTDDNYDEVAVLVPEFVTIPESVRFIDDVALQAEHGSDQKIITLRRPSQTGAPRTALK